VGVCRVCGKVSKVVSDVIGLCAECIRSKYEVVSEVTELHKLSRELLNLPQYSRTSGGLRCSLCVNECNLVEGGRGFCGNYVAGGGRLQPVTGSYDIAYGSWYYDPHPTNCVAYPICPAVTGRGYPKYAVRPNGEVGYYNLAVFYATCSLNCLYCQNWRGRADALRFNQVMSVSELVNAALNSRVTCICYFGGDPSPNSIHALKVSRGVLKEVRKSGRVMRICWETNGTEDPRIMREMARVSLESGGIVKVDLKAWTPQMYQVLTGVNAIDRVKENIKLVASMRCLRDEPPLLVVSILVVPGYVDDVELRGMAEFISSVDAEIPVVLLAFHPHHILRDLPPTSRGHMDEAVKIMRSCGVRNVYIGNEWLLGNYY